MNLTTNCTGNAYPSQWNIVYAKSKSCLFCLQTNVCVCFKFILKKDTDRIFTELDRITIYLNIRFKTI